ncbi:MAG TPA: NADH-quinone oxidoreductase subunit NuoE [bacterium]|nr:NADH-quinone oxidoreductase subunit NuoE [bacterium]
MTARVLSDATLGEIARLRGLYPRAQSALLPALHAAQDQVGYLSSEAMEDVADALDLSATEVASVASYYSMFFTEPVGRHKVRVCTNVSCYLNGAEQVLHHVCERLGVSPGQTTPDGRVLVEAVECLGACEEAPVLLADATRHPRVTAAVIDELLKELR